MTWTGLHDAVLHHNVDEVQRRVHSNPEEALKVDDHGSTPLHMACWEHADLVIIQALMEAYPEGVLEHNTHGDTPLHVLLSNPYASPDIVRALVKTNPIVASMRNKEGLMPLHALCRSDPSNHDVMELLLETYPSAALTPIKMGDPAPNKRVDSLDQRKATDHFLLPGAVQLSSSPSSAMDLEFRDRRRQVRDGAYPLHMALAASRKPAQDTVRMLVHGAPEVLDKTNKFGETPLHVALTNDAPAAIIDELVSQTKYGPSALSMAETRHGNLPIHVAAMHGCDAHVARSMVELKPETIEVVNNHGMKAFELAVLSGRCNGDVIRLWKI